MATEAPPLSNVTNELLAAAIEAVDARKKTHKAAGKAVTAELKVWEERGVNPKALKDALKFRDVPEDEFSGQMSQFLRMMNIEGYAVGGAMFDGLDLTPLGPVAEAKHREWQAYDLGYQHALGGEPKESNKCRPGTADFVSWDRGWFDGEAVMAKLRTQGETPAPTRRERAAPPARQTQPEREADPMWDDEKQAEASKVADEMDALNAANDEDDPGLGLPDPAAAPKRRGRPVGSGRKPASAHVD